MQGQTFHFPPYQLAPEVDLLFRDGVPVSLEPRAVQVLRYLLRHRDRVVPKDELLDQVWVDVFTTDAVLKQAISQIRRALGDAADTPRYIQTFHARGYRFIAPVIPGDGSEDKAAPDKIYVLPHASATERGGSTDLHSQSHGEVEASAAREYVAPPNYDLLVGRETELSLLQAEYGRALLGGAQPVVVKGEPGIGKTQLARHFGRWVRDEKASFAYTRFFDYEGSRLAPYEAFIDLLRAALGSRSSQEGNRDRTASARELREAVESRCGVRLPDELFGGESTRVPLAHVGASASDHFRISVPLGQAFLRLSRERPLVMVLDDLQWADDASLDFLSYLMRARADEPLLLILLARGEEASETGHELAQWLKQQAGYRSFTVVNLRPLGEGACRTAVEEAFGGARRAPLVPQSDAVLMHRVTGGNPYFLIETLRLLVSQGVIREGFGATGGDKRWQWHGIEDVPLPESLVMAAMGKLERLPPELRELLEQAAVLGDEFRVETLARMSGRVEDELDERLREAVHLGVLSERGVSVGEDYRFYHTILRRVLYDNLAGRLRRRLHLRAATAIEEVYARHPERVADALSAHYEASGDALRAFRWGLRAWAAASARWHWNEAVACIERARRMAAQLDFADPVVKTHAALRGDTREESGTPSASEKLEMLLALCESFNAVGRNKELEPVVRESLALARALGDEGAEAALLLQTGLVHIALSQYVEAQRATAEASEIYGRLGDTERARLALVQLASIRASMGDYEAAGQLVEGILEEGSAEEATAATAAGVLGWARALQGRYGEGVELLKRALRHHESSGNVRLRAQVLRRLHWADLSRGQYESAIALAARAQKDFQTIGDLFGEAKTYMGIGQARIAQGLYDEGISYLRRTLDSLKTNGDAHCEAETLWLLGRAHCAAGQREEAETLLARALEMIRAIGDRDDEFRILVDQARVDVSRDDHEAALSKASGAARIAGELNCRDGLGAARVEQSHAYRLSGDARRAVKTAEEAVRLLEETGSGERWRGYWTLALALDAQARAGHTVAGEKTLATLSRSVELLNEMRAQFASGDEGRRAAMLRAHAQVARLLYDKLLLSNRTKDAQALSLQWSLGEDAPPAAPARRA